MTDPEKHLQTLHKAYESWLAAADHTVEFRREASVENIPTSMDVLYFLPIEGPNEDDISIAATAGMSLFAMPNSDRHIELAYEFKGSGQEKQREAWAKRLAELAVIPFRDNEAFEIPMILERVNLPPFEKMTCAILSAWDYNSTVSLPGIQPKVELVRLTPIFESEVAMVKEMGPEKALARWLAKGVELYDFDRSPSP